MDEATASVDYESDARIQQMVRRDFAGQCTVIAIAHRLHTVAFFDRIMVLSGGEALEEGKPEALLMQEGGTLRALAEESGDFEGLLRVARGGEA